MSDGWLEFLLAFAACFASHAVPVRPPVRAVIERHIGARAFGPLNSGLSLVMLAWLIGAAGRAPYVGLWPAAVWQAHLALAVMAVVCAIVALSLGRANPFSFGGGRGSRFDPARPGLVRWMRHPLLVALFLWSGVHVIANGDLAHVLVFGAFALFSLVGQRLIARRKRRVDAAGWDALRAAVAAARGAPAFDLRELMVRGIVAVLLFSGLLAAHPYLFGVDPLR